MAFSSRGIDVMEEGEYVNGSAWIWPASDMDFWKIDNKVTSVKIKWSSGHDNIKSDMWF